ncbi:uncharacterized protein L969DRAFT_93820 [Mixia osmundae IAM 14324]|uniref:Major facilitator superfamily (MFS) profile domain-containing protein n=1 Tax=Mixia osmundae (strain CBS 9802 / IAM 14324 / JCM 22182 / KY 12970) TaxID=764103 RepID=G7E9P1_MIXOS|nr:uncharacterized protein L969DRAFT_93820 [Mixia osmundae IAM 14324]KEI39991.1 hypothetical protein L969DRAFT_93820 [Mixia osmundae IAM 14324]GAA99360.1 hypothetical protein E5Q_06056 [Mixia osmundae IAM 14324]
MASRSPSDGTAPPAPSDGGTLIEGALAIEQPPVGSPTFVDSDASSQTAPTQKIDERTPLLAGRSRSVDDDEEDHEIPFDERPWYKRPSPLWLIPTSLAMATCMGMTIGPKVEIYNALVCQRLYPMSDNSTSIIQYNAPSYDGSSTQSSSIDLTFVSSSVADQIEAMTPEQCRQSPRVQRKVAQLNIMITLAMGILSAFTAGYWGSMSDRRGRLSIMTVSLIGLLSADLVFLLTVKFSHVVDYRMLVLGPLIDGLLGGYATATACTNAYIADCTEAGSRARIFSVFSGLLFGGIALGPIIGSVVVRASGNVLLPFYLTTAVHSLEVLGVLFILPESLTRKRQREARAKRQQRRTEQDKQDRESEERHHAEQARLSPLRAFVARSRRRIGKGASTATAFTRALAVILPKKMEDYSESDVPKILRKTDQRRRDWSLTFVALAYALWVMMISIYAVKIQYAQYRFAWGPVETGYLLTAIGVSRVIALTLLLPLAIRWLRKKYVTARMPDYTEGMTMPLASEDQLVADYEDHATHVKLLHDSHFDLSLARWSVFLDAAAYVLLLATTTSAQFIFAVCAQSFASGFGPAMQSLALALSPAQEAGKLLAAFSVIQSIMSQVIGPLVFGVLFSLSVETWPELIFAFGLFMFVLSFIALLFVRLPSASKAAQELASASHSAFSRFAPGTGSASPTFA